MPGPSRVLRALACASLLAPAACQEPAPSATPPVGLSDHLAVLGLVGTWRWAHVVDDPGLRRLEREIWQFWPTAAPGAELAGRYLREVTVRSATEPFECNQARTYQQRATFELLAVAHGGALEIVETGYQAQPSPCDHGFRRLGRYRVELRRGRAHLQFEDGEQTLWRVDDQVPSPPAPPWPTESPPFAGAWRWQNRDRDDQGLWQLEEERWDLGGPAALTPPAQLRDGATFGAIYTRRVTVESPDGAPLPCAAGPRYGYEDRYLLEGQRRDGILLLRETAVAAGEHPCLRDRAVRTLETATLEIIGEELVLEWRGKRRQVLRRAAPALVPTLRVAAP